MRKSILLLALMALSFFISISPAAAEVGPKETVEIVLQQIKQKGGPAGMMDYVHWDSAYNNLPEIEKKNFNVQSSSELKELYKVMFENPDLFMKQQMRKRFGNLEPNQKAAFETQLDQMANMMKEKIKEQKDKMARTNFTIGDVDVEGDNATVKVTSALDGKTKQTDVKLVKIDGKWLFPGFQMAAQHGKGTPPPNTSRPPAERKAEKDAANKPVAAKPEAK